MNRNSFLTPEFFDFSLFEVSNGFYGVVLYGEHSPSFSVLLVL
jgi:hypothetical protein